MRHRRIEIVAYLLVLVLIGLAAAVAAVRSRPAGPAGPAASTAEPSPPPVAAPDKARGAELYRAECAACHPAGRPIPGAGGYAGSDGREALIDLLLTGSIAGEAGAHPDAGHLGDADVAALAGHLLDLWGDSGAEIPPGEIAARRGLAP